MAWVQLRFEVMGEVQVSRAFEAIERDARDMRDPLQRVGDSLLRFVFEQFRTEGAAGLGSRWRPLNAAYAAWKERQVGDEPILVFSQQMRGTLLSRESVTVTPQRMVYRPTGEHADIASYHQAGSADRGLPQRKIVALPDTVKRSWERYFHEWLRRDVLWSFS